MGPCTASSCCCQAPNLPWAPVPTPHAAARPVFCHGPCKYRLLMLLPGPECVMGPCTASPIAAVSIATLCHVPLSGLLTLLVVSIFVIGCCMASHCCCLQRHTVAPHSGFGPVTAQMSEVCGDSKIEGTHLHVILTVSIISLPQQTPRAFKLKVHVLH
ncbi:unnamed protein product [Staurois parvus]|uniref:Uncharacterized protein n=1 Tax=Staurois parvus TaxID=386267 RepID=A0ABN9GJH0_9NEOB|nr:unnamed protein product [Staurois parvus]